MNFNDVNVSCPILKGHLERIEPLFQRMPEGVDITTALEQVVVDSANNEDWSIYKKYKDELESEYQFLELEVSELIQGLDFIAKQYAMSYVSKAHPDMFDDELSELALLSKEANRLLYYVDRIDPSIVELLKLVQNSDPEIVGPRFVEGYFDELRENLNTLVSLRESLKNTDFAKFHKIGVKSPKGNMPLHMWLWYLRKFWIEGVGRSFKFDGHSGKNGRTRFLNFAMYCMDKLHSEIAYVTIENALIKYEKNEKFRVQLDKSLAG
ncbi:hypothetical protein [Hellea balneolensis]|uniref:hypothetical protein n=1 Tax=Hellea balneolensis TaxID=287478 RepID=UPI0004275541|nr:hypothetical protein [Hellea balneolensis]